MDAKITQTIADLLPLLRQFCQGEVGIALGGAHAKGVADSESDLDFYLFARKIIPNEQRKQLLQASVNNITEIYSWGDDANFMQAGTDFTYQGQRIECWLRHIDDIGQTVADCVAGIVKRDLVTWTVMGFFNHCTLSDLQSMISVADDDGILAQWQAQVAVYPPKLRQAIIVEHLNAAKFWPHNFHYKSAIKRQDIIYTAGIVQQVVFNLIQVIFALNETYFPGEKKLAAALNHLSLKPDRFAERIEMLLVPPIMEGKLFLVDQQQALIGLTNEVEQLVKVAGLFGE